MKKSLLGMLVGASLLLMVPAQANAEITPVTPNAQSMTKSLLNWIAEMPDRENERVLSGAFGGYAEREFSLHEANRLYQQTGKMPAIYGGDYAALNRFDWQNPLDAISTSINDELISYYDDGGLVQLSVHFPNPVYQNGNLNTPISNEQYRRILNDNTPEGGRFNRMLDKVADGLREFEDQEIPVLFRPLHEGNSYSFWWSMSGSVNEAERVTLYKQLYQKIFHHLTVNHDLTNLIWVYSPGEWKVTKRRCIQAIAMSILSDLMFIQMTIFPMYGVIRKCLISANRLHLQKSVRKRQMASLTIRMSLTPFVRTIPKRPISSLGMRCGAS